MTIRVTLFDAEGRDRDLNLADMNVSRLGESHLLWIDVEGRAEGEVRAVAERLGLPREVTEDLLDEVEEPHLHLYSDFFTLDVRTLEERGGKLENVEIDFVAGRNFVLTVHPCPVAFLQAFREQQRGDTDLGALSSSAFLAALLDWLLGGYYRTIDTMEAELDRLDTAILAKGMPDDDLLTRIVRHRRRVSDVRTALAAHREVFAALARPDFWFGQQGAASVHFVALFSRFERTLSAVEDARSLVIGTFDLYMARSAERTNDIVRVLTIATVLLGLGAFVSGLFGMNTGEPWENMGVRGFYRVLGLILVLAALVLVFARRRRWW
ncbi:magnesium transporter CorA family protein [Deinococcus yavapaiensis]|uniref:Mg2+ and Co2+ transporter CorA n=1 Tax=Deinococcus yavapaiensis KR-236 TaxID=694435 RepID=A0A318S856_9DEIO|nr:CorA family divalent cation transporter [Deinococcus yavapaiensis]PYE54632.1 Mg2+ and Co2+ transporter CorA [Deinococcus yavapaiensis KR-236]